MGIFKIALRAFLIGLFWTSAYGASQTMDQLCKKYGISQNELSQFEKVYLDSEFGLKRLTGLREQLAQYTSKEIATSDLIDFAELFSQKVDSLAQSRLSEFGAGFGLTQKDFDKAMDDGLDDVDGKDPNQFLENLAKSLIKSANKSKLTKEKALILAKSLQIRMDMTMMSPHLKDEDYMRRLLGEKILDRIMLERVSRPGGVR